MITLLTDFGLVDHYVGVMKGVIATIAPEQRVVDITHEVPPFQVMEGAFLLEQAWRFFPMGTVHVAVVDPGVGGERRPLLVEAGGHFFIGPDNGIFSFVLGEKAARAWVLDESRYWLPRVSSTFHGRDVFAPVAARVAKGLPASIFGTRVEDALRSPAVEPVRMSRRNWMGAVLHVDRFGNLVTNFRIADYPQIPRGDFAMVVGMEEVDFYSATYAGCPEDTLAVIPGSSGYFDVSLARGNAARRTGLAAGSPVELTVLG